MGYNQEGVEKAVRDLLIAIGEDPDREGLQETPARMGRAWKEAVSGMLTDPAQPLEKQFQVGRGFFSSLAGARASNRPGGGCLNGKAKSSRGRSGNRRGASMYVHAGD